MFFFYNLKFFYQKFITYSKQCASYWLFLIGNFAMKPLSCSVQYFYVSHNFLLWCASWNSMCIVFDQRSVTVAKNCLLKVRLPEKTGWKILLHCLQSTDTCNKRILVLEKMLFLLLLSLRYCNHLQILSFNKFSFSMRLLHHNFSPK